MEQVDVDPDSGGGLTVDKIIRKLRKKLRQIERLELVNRGLSYEEEQKVQSKSAIRQQLKHYLSQVTVKDDEQEHSNISISSQFSDTDDSFIETDSKSVSEELATVTSQSPQQARGDTAEKCIDEKVCETPEKKIAPSVKGDSQNKAAAEKRAAKEISAVTSKGQKVATENVKKEKLNTFEKNFISSVIHVTALESHSDIITATVIEDNILITASRDTTVKCWSLESGQELRSLGSHTESVTCLTVLSSQDYLQAFSDSDAIPGEPVIVSGSWDCTVKFWGMHSGKLLGSIYTFNPVTQVCFLPLGRHLITGSDGGKLELWNIETKANVFTSRSFEAAVVGIKVEDDAVIYSCAADGMIQVYKASEEGNLKRLFVSDDLRSVGGKPVHLSHIGCLEAWKGKMLVGQDTGNVKIVDWKKGTVEKLKNHHSHFSFTDAIRYHGDVLVMSSYDLDNGQGYVNVCNGQTFKYNGTVDDGNTERILCVDFVCSGTSGHMTIVTGGMELKVWKIMPKSQSKASTEDKPVVKFNPSLSKPAEDSDSDEEEDEDYDERDDSEEEDNVANRHQSGYNKKSNLEATDGGLWSWCSLL